MQQRSVNSIKIRTDKLIEDGLVFGRIVQAGQEILGPK